MSAIHPPTRLLFLLDFKPTIWSYFSQLCKDFKLEPEIWHHFSQEELISLPSLYTVPLGTTRVQFLEHAAAFCLFSWEIQVSNCSPSTLDK